MSEIRKSEQVQSREKETQGVEQPTDVGSSSFEVGDFYRQLTHEQDSQMRRYREFAIQIAEAVDKRGGRALVVGGFTRDDIMRSFGYGMKSKDIDIEIYGIEKDELRDMLHSLGRTKDDVGETFEVFLVFGPDFEPGDQGVDVSLPRRDKQVGPKHTDVETEYDPNMSYDEAFRRRDITINAIGLDPLTGELIDEHGGIRDIQNGIIRKVSEETFAQDPLRPMRVAQFAARFGFEVEPATLEFCRQVDLTNLAGDKIRDEWLKLLTKSSKPSIGIEIARKIGLFEQIHKDLNELLSVSKDDTEYQEGGYYDNLLNSVDAAALVFRRLGLTEKNAEDLMFMTLAKELNQKAFTFLYIENRLEKKRAARLTQLIESRGFLRDNPNFQEVDVRHLANEVHPGTIQKLAWLMEVDARVTDPDMKEFDAGKRLIVMAEELGLREAKPARLIQGGDLIKIGYIKGPDVGQGLREVYEAQLDGRVNTYEEAMAYALAIMPQN